MCATHTGCCCISMCACVQQYLVPPLFPPHSSVFNSSLPSLNDVAQHLPPIQSPVRSCVGPVRLRPFRIISFHFFFVLFFPRQTLQRSNNNNSCNNSSCVCGTTVNGVTPRVEREREKKETAEKVERIVAG